MSEPARKVVTRAPPRTVRILNLNGVLPHPVEAESKLEADCVRVAALSPVTRSIVSQAFRLPVSPKGYVPDFLITTLGRLHLVIEVKLERKVSDYVDLFDRAAEHLAAKGFVFAVATEKALRRERIHERAQLILRYSKATYSGEEKSRALACVSSAAKGIALGSVVKKAQVRREVIFHLISRKLLSTGRKLSIDDSAIVTAPAAADCSEMLTLMRWLSVEPWPIGTQVRMPA